MVRIIGSEIREAAFQRASTPIGFYTNGISEEIPRWRINSESFYQWERGLRVPIKYHRTVDAMDSVYISVKKQKTRHQKLDEDLFKDPAVMGIKKSSSPSVNPPVVQPDAIHYSGLDFIRNYNTFLGSKIRHCAQIEAILRAEFVYGTHF